MQILKERTGENHHRTLKSKAVLALTWKTLGRTTDAIDLLRDYVIMGMGS